MKKAAEKEVFADIPCTNVTDRVTYLNNPEVRAALHVPEHVKEWEACTTLPYNRQYTDLAPQYFKVLERVSREGDGWLKYYSRQIDALGHF